MIYIHLTARNVISMGYGSYKPSALVIVLQEDLKCCKLALERLDAIRKYPEFRRDTPLSHFMTLIFESEEQKNIFVMTYL